MVSFLGASSLKVILYRHIFLVRTFKEMLLIFTVKIFFILTCDSRSFLFLGPGKFLSLEFPGNTPTFDPMGN